MRTRLADPDFEPTDEELMALSRAAFADVGERHRVALAKLHAEIAEARRQKRLALTKDAQGQGSGSKS
jgi:hypothetical protein